MMAAMVERKCGSAVLELDEEPLERREVDGVPFESALLTTLGGPEEPDRESLVRRRRAFARLSKLVTAGGSVILDADDPEADPLGAVNLEARRVTFGMEKPAHVSAILDRLDPSGARFRLRGFDREATITLRLSGQEHVRHALASAALAWSRGIPLRAVVDGLESVSRLPGRLEPVVEGQDFEVRIDQARTASELVRALNTLRGIIPGRLICVIGAQGGSQRLRRVALGRAAEAAADRVVLTTDNPRLENSDSILDDLLAGFRHPGKVFVEPDRRAAIAHALADARPGDAVLIAGKGHHSYQILADRVFPFDDAQVAAEWLRANRVARRTSA
jgi:UDP-N-acetylmuramoyl-L-alanyl-D-glutamate--2,6-diaminopimelate ligase